jgi:hypothetical protein
VGRRRVVVFCLLAAMAGAVALGVPAPAAATSVCGKRVVEDWRDNGRIDGLYKLHCYEDAIDAIPQELRDYTNAEDVIRQAYLARTGASLVPPPDGKSVQSSGPDSGPSPEVAPTVNTSGTTDIPLPVYVLGVLALVLLGAGALGYVSRRRSGGDDELPPA